MTEEEDSVIFVRKSRMSTIVHVDFPKSQTLVTRFEFEFSNGCVGKAHIDFDGNSSASAASITRDRWTDGWEFY